MGGRKRAVVLLSGGVDSSTALAVALREGFEAHSISFDYGQRNRAELGAASAVAVSLGAERHLTVSVDMRSIGGSALTGEAEVPKCRAPDEIAGGVPATYVPARNTVFLALALAWAEAIGARDIFTGIHAGDCCGYPDCRPEFVEAFERLANLGTKSGVEGKTIRIHAPLLHMSKSEIIRLGMELGVDYSLTHSCYDPDEKGPACGQCDSCIIRIKGFAEAGVEDPIDYARGS